MAIAEIITEIDAEIDRLEQARKLLSNGRNVRLDPLAIKKDPAWRKRALSVEARKKIAEAQRKRWAAVKKQAK